LVDDSIGIAMLDGRRNLERFAADAASVAGHQLGWPSSFCSSMTVELAVADYRPRLT
jgi:hypothetical protein